MSIKQQAHEIVDALPDDADWNELVKSLYRNQKITLGMTDLELTQKDLSEAEISTIMGRLESSSSRPDDMRDTRSYNPGNAATLGMVAGIVAIFFAFVFPPITWLAAPIAVVAGAIGVKHHQPRAWVPILMAIVSMAPMIMVLSEHVDYFK
ncbi:MULTISPECIES: hypothetical protein [Piscirickettsiaceae]|uniref:Uncharacterized protein n=1 Tax=Hydrogenovibrio thermophilus TaxID=265883 RepID=A0A410H371_9GAMM|nr:MULTISPECIES: hypothetical protein [Piscirickettsiaceae]AZR82099.1 hypothetical protein AYJ59_07245 [Thiomicrospira sp. S5]QAB15364.1 hypothetical protein EPV75_06640 [Hydrogenovibrio thermophilus]